MFYALNVKVIMATFGSLTVRRKIETIKRSLSQFEIFPPRNRQQLSTPSHPHHRFITGYLLGHGRKNERKPPRLHRQKSWCCENSAILQFSSEASAIFFLFLIQETLAFILFSFSKTHQDVFRTRRSRGNWCIVVLTLVYEPV